jgi:tyrosyl-tRNA synthetase
MHQPQIVDNYNWYRDMDLLRFLDQVGAKMRVASLISRDSVKSRMQSEQGLSFSELTYQLLQAYDFYHLHKHYNCQLQIGGSDQWGNIMSGLDLISKLREERDANVHGLTMPLLVTSSGEKMGKSAGNAKWLDPERTSPFELYQYFADMSDQDAVEYLPKMSLRRLPDLEEVQREHWKRPEMRLAQRQLAFDVTALVHSVDDAQKSERASDILYGSKDLTPADLEVLHLALAGSHLGQMVRTGSSEDLIGSRIVDILAASSDGAVSKSNDEAKSIRFKLYM